MRLPLLPTHWSYIAGSEYEAGDGWKTVGYTEDEEVRYGTDDEPHNTEDEALNEAGDEATDEAVGEAVGEVVDEGTDG